jgi:truncated hemoglobin YjbI
MAPTTTLYERLGGDEVVTLLTIAFFDEIVENPDLSRFFKHISVSAFKSHQVKLFRVIFGKEEEKPAPDDLLDFMLKSHTRLFRDFGLDETHFDLVANCFVQGLQSFQVDQPTIDECVAILVPLRVVFEYGAKVAAKEKAMDATQLKKFPLASAKTIGTETPATLPEYSKIDIPSWLPQALGKRSSQSIVRAWTCDLTDRFGADGDRYIADIFMDQAYMDHHVYLVAFLELAFLPESIKGEERTNILNLVLYPRGRDKAPLSRRIFDRMINQFLVTCDAMGMSQGAASLATHKLSAFRPNFAKKTFKANGMNGSHVLRRRQKVKVLLDTSVMKPAQTPVREMSRKWFQSSDMASRSSNSVWTSNSKKAGKQGLSLFGAFRSNNEVKRHQTANTAA